MAFVLRIKLKNKFSVLNSKRSITNAQPYTGPYEPFLNGDSANYIEELYKSWRSNPGSVHSSWQTFFELHNKNSSPGFAYQSPLKGITQTVGAGTKGTGDKVCSVKPQIKSQPQTTVSPTLSLGGAASIEEHLHIAMIIRAYQLRGHLKADVDPIHYFRSQEKREKDETGMNPVLRKLSLPQDMNAVYTLPDFTYIGGEQKELPLQEIIVRLENAYCNTIGIEPSVMFSNELKFIQNYFESPGKFPGITKEEKIRYLESVMQAFLFEGFLSKKWPSEKRFGIDGSEGVIPCMNAFIHSASDYGGKSFLIGMAHRGRLNVMANVIKMQLSPVMSQFVAFEKESDSLGDVRYHLGTRNTILHPKSNKPITITLMSNPSHLEAVDPVLEGRTRAEQIIMENNDKNLVWPILIHGDAAMCGQGVVYETFHLSELPCYETGGTIHFVINNQIGFTTEPGLSRSSTYCTAVAKVLESPIFHVNGNDIEALVKVAKIAAEYRATFKRDVVIDVVSYRRLGHSEVDEPGFTNPMMYKKIKQAKPVHELYTEQLYNEKVITKEEVAKMADDYEKMLEEAYQIAMKTKSLGTNVWIDSPWKKFFDKSKDPLMIPETGVKLETLQKIATSITVPPKDFNLHRGLERIFAQRKKNIENDIVDWSCGETFAYGSLLQEGYYVRLSGQDVERGTFSHRHHVLHDQKVKDKRFNVLKNLFPSQGKYSICNSSLSEFGILGFEHGMSLISPKVLIMWEAQFGDFCNTAQTIIDQFLSSGEGKWIRQSGLVMLLPHGMEGMGPEHSSGRIERFLQMCNDDDSEVNLNMGEQMKQCNWFIANPSTPANFFHLIRRQVKLNYRKPLIIFTPKYLLRYPKCISSLQDFLGPTKFKPYLPDPHVPPSPEVMKLLLCSGKVYYELIEERDKVGLQNKIAIGRLEQISPVPYEDIITDAVNNYPKARVFWVQEEHKNQGSWSYMSPRLNKAIGNDKGPVNYIGRRVSSSAGAGYKTIHDMEKKEFLSAAMSI